MIVLNRYVPTTVQNVIVVQLTQLWLNHWLLKWQFYETGAPTGTGPRPFQCHKQIVPGVRIPTDVFVQVSEVTFVSVQVTEKTRERFQLLAHPSASYWPTPLPVIGPPLCQLLAHPPASYWPTSLPVICPPLCQLLAHPSASYWPTPLPVIGPPLCQLLAHPSASYWPTPLPVIGPPFCQLLAHPSASYWPTPLPVIGPPLCQFRRFSDGFCVP